MGVCALSDNLQNRCSTLSSMKYLWPYHTLTGSLPCENDGPVDCVSFSQIDHPNRLIDVVIIENSAIR